MKAYLFGQYTVEIDPQCLDVGGSWQDVTWRDGIPVAANSELLQMVYGWMSLYHNPVVLDIGANTGSFSLLAAIHPGATIVAFEPNPLVESLLRHNVYLNRIENRVLMMGYALSNFVGTAQLKCPNMRGHSGMACLGNPQRFDRWADWDGWYEITVPVKTLDSLELPRVDIIKCDAEGSELHIFQGGEQLIRKWMPRILFECYAPNTRQLGYEPSEILKLLDSWGYTLGDIGEEDACAIP